MSFIASKYIIKLSELKYFKKNNNKHSVRKFGRFNFMIGVRRAQSIGLHAKAANDLNRKLVDLLCNNSYYSITFCIIYYFTF